MRIRSAILTLGALVGLACLLLAAASVLFGLQPAIVISGSMEPTIPTGSLTIGRLVPASEIAVGDVVTVPRPTGGLVTHRVISADQVGDTTRVTLQGDANSIADPLPYQIDKAHLVVASIPRLGAIVAALRSTSSLVLLGSLAVLLVVAFLAQKPTRIDDSEDMPDEGAESTPVGSALQSEMTRANQQPDI